MDSPFAESAVLYRQRGWHGVIPVTGKHPPVHGYTGRHGAWPSDDDVTRWLRERGADNVALRLTSDVIGLDVDAYDGRTGRETLHRWQEEHGTLPDTWTSTSRVDGTGSGIRFYRVPHGVHWRSSLGQHSHVEVIQSGHRYAVVWPSVHPETHHMYAWYGPDGSTCDVPPTVSDLPELPAAWVAALSRDGAGTGGGESTRDGHASEHTSSGVDEHGEPVDVETFDMDGRPIDVARLFRDGIPVGEQQNTLFAYLCSMRSRGMKRDEMLLAASHVLNRSATGDPDHPWTADDVRELVDRVRREYSPGTWALPGDVSDVAAWAESIGPRDSSGEHESARSSVDGDASRSPDARPHIQVNATDYGNGQLFAHVNRGRVLFAADAGVWYVWNGVRWKQSHANEVLELTSHVLIELYARARQLAGQEDAHGNDLGARMGAWANSSESLPRLKAMVEVASSLAELRTTTRAFDRDPYVLNCPNGTLDLRTGALREHDPTDLCSQVTSVPYDSHADCPRWTQHVDFVTRGDRDVAGYIQRSLGYTLTGDVSERAFFFLEGTGSNGKNALIEPVIDVLGSYAYTTTSRLLTGGDDQHPEVFANLLGKRLVYTDEPRAGRALNVERIKLLTGARDVEGRQLYGKAFVLPIMFKLWITGNGKPTLKDPSDGVWNRLKYVECLGKVGRDVATVKNFGDVLYQEEARGILAWLVRGALDWRSRGDLATPQSVTDAVAEYHEEEDQVALWLSERLEPDEDGWSFIPTAELYADYQLWEAMQGVKSWESLSSKHFQRQLKAHGFVASRQRYNGVQYRGWFGYRWRASASQ